MIIARPTRAKVRFELSPKGFSLLETLLSLSIASIFILSANQLVIHFFERDAWWRTLQKMIVNQQVATQTIMRLHQSACQLGLQRAEVNSWRLAITTSRGCESHDIRFVNSNDQWQKRRVGGRYSSFLADTKLLKTVYGVAQQNTCHVQRWTTAVANVEAQNIIFIKLTLAVGVLAQNSASSLPSGWYLGNHGNAAQYGTNWVWQDLQLAIPLPCTLSS